MTYVFFLTRIAGKNNERFLKMSYFRKILWGKHLHKTSAGLSSYDLNTALCCVKRTIPYYTILGVSVVILM